MIRTATPMIDEKSFIEFFEKEYGVIFVDSKTGMKALDVIENKKIDSNPFSEPTYKSGYDRFLEEEGDGE